MEPGRQIADYADSFTTGTALEGPLKRTYCFRGIYNTRMMRMPQPENIKSDLQPYFRRIHALFSPEFSTVVADVSLFISQTVRDGFETAFAQLPVHGKVKSGGPFIEVAEAIVECHLRFVRQSERDIVRKSLLEAYTQFAGPQYILEPVSKTRLVGSLRRSGSNRKFITTLLSLHLFNLICIGFQDELRARMPKVKSFNLYMSGVETVCRDAVAAAAKRQTGNIDEKWAKAVAKNIEAQLLHSPVRPRNAL